MAKHYNKFEKSDNLSKLIIDLTILEQFYGTSLDARALRKTIDGVKVLADKSRIAELQEIIDFMTSELENKNLALENKTKHEQAIACLNSEIETIKKSID